MIEDADRPECGCTFHTCVRQVKNSEPYKHLRNARREILLAAKSLIDICIDRLDAVNESENKTQAHKVDIE